MDKVSGSEDSRFDSCLARSAVFFASRSLYSRPQAIWFEMVPVCVFCYCCSSVCLFFQQMFCSLIANYVNEVNETELTNNQQLIQFKLLLCFIVNFTICNYFTIAIHNHGLTLATHMESDPEVGLGIV